ncbi:hypothetical protein SEA_FRAYBELL_7 [Mycobacterium phage FrayBell]|nr:hypothetical protein SEA_FRAYBELL_7 [Mycobacterium phage FrayBell]
MTNELRDVLTTIECSRPGDPYTLFKSGTHLDVHLAGRSKTGGTGLILCGFDRFPARRERQMDCRVLGRWGSYWTQIPTPPVPGLPRTDRWSPH